MSRANPANLGVGVMSLFLAAPILLPAHAGAQEGDAVGSHKHDQDHRDQRLAKGMRKMFEAQARAKQDEDLEAAFENVDVPQHQKVGLRQLFARIFEAYDLVYTTDEFKLLVADGDVAIARIKQTIQKVGGPIFRDNQKDFLQVFRRKDGRWWIHDQVILETTMLAPAAAPTSQPSRSPTAPPPAPPGQGADSPPDKVLEVPSTPVND